MPNRNAEVQENMRRQLRVKRRRKPDHDEERPGMGCGDPACKYHQPVKPFPPKGAKP